MSDTDTITLGAPVSPAMKALVHGPVQTPIPNDVYREIKPNLEPYDHQRRGVNRAIAEFLSCGYFALFMEMGTGKTKCTLDSAMVLAARGKIEGLVIVAPKALLSTWEKEEIPKHLSIPYRIYTWDGRVSKKSQAEFEAVLTCGAFPIFIVNVEAFQQVNETMQLRLKDFVAARKCLLAVDESTFIKGDTANRAKKVVGLGKLVPYRTILTGTEIVNSPLDLYMQMKFLNPSFWGDRVSFFMFRARYAQLADEYGAGGKTHKKVVGFQRMDEFMAKINAHCFRALRKDCLDLPPTIEIVMKVPLSAAQEKVYSSLKAHLAAMLSSGEVVSVPNKIALFTKFRQIPGGSILVEGRHTLVDPKPPKLEALIAEVQDTDEQVIVWAAFSHEITMIAEVLAPFGRAVVFDGSVPQGKRDQNKLDFQEGRARFFVGNPAAAGFGLNLQNCHIAYTYSRVLSPGQEWQADARITRPGQTEKCLYKRLVAPDTVDERIEALLAEKKDLLSQLQSMSLADIFSIV